MKALKPLLREWNKNVFFGKVEVNKALTLNQVEFWDKVEVARPLVVHELEARRGTNEDFKKWVLLEEISWWHKSRELWLKEGGRNTRFFHKMANAHMRSSMARVKINGVWSTKENEIREGVVNEFKLLLSTAGGWRPSIGGLSFARLEVVDRARLEEPFSKQEVFKALKGFSGNKAPKPDGFSMAFWQSSWGFVKEEVMGFFREFHDHNCFVKSLNATFIVLIPKKGGTEDLRDFRPISLVGSLYKWLAKVLANRLKLLVGKVVSKAQNAFVKGRQILDAALVANGVIDSILKSNEGVVLCKLDIEKAYDNVDWSFLLSVISMMGFGEKWLRWMQWCISTTSFFILVNGTSLVFFQSFRGLRQGDPLSPYLFVIAMEALSCLLKRAVSGGFLLAYKVRGRGGEGAHVCHLLFVDDTLVFSAATQDQIKYLSWTLMWFEAISGLIINLDKSKLIPVGCVENVKVLVAELGCKVRSLPSSYLGLLLGALFKFVAAWDGVEERF